jgi:hypothetical protein
MIDLILERGCSHDGCFEEYDFIVYEKKLCLNHSPNEYKINIKRLCKYCDIEEDSDFICKECKLISNKKEWAVVRHLRKNIITKFTHDSSIMLNGCSKRRPDVFFDLDKHCVIVEVDENQHKSYQDVCECARINEIVNGIGGRSVIFIRFNPDTSKNKKTKINLNLAHKLELLIKTIKEEILYEHDKFQVKIIQLYYDDDHDDYVEKKIENITDLVSI